MTEKMVTGRCCVSTSRITLALEFNLFEYKQKVVIMTYAYIIDLSDIYFFNLSMDG